MIWPIPAVEGVLTSEQVAETAASIAAMQEPSGAVPWTPGEKTDVWNHVEGAMAMLVGGQVEAAERAYAWCAQTQRADGSWPMEIVVGDIKDASGETNMSAYLAVGVWHHWLLRRDRAFVNRMWPVVHKALDFVVGLQLPFGGIAWSQEWDLRPDGSWGPAKVNEQALVAGSSSIYQALRAGVALAELVGDPQVDWELAGGRLGHALRRHRDDFLDKSEFSMDWYYPVLGGAVRGTAAVELLEGKWDEFVVDGLGIRCVNNRPWVTGAETCELVMSLDAIGDHERALAAATGPAGCGPTRSTGRTSTPPTPRPRWCWPPTSCPAPRRVRGSCAATIWPRTSTRSLSSAAALTGQPTSLLSGTSPSSS
jgi:hypothetical protein